MRLILASQSPRRRELLHTIGLSFEVQPADVDESWVAGEDPVAYVERVARSKAVAVAAVAPRDACVLAADTTVDRDGEILAKPADDAEAARMLRSLSGRTHLVHTAVVGCARDQVHTETVTTAVTFAALADAEIDWYLSIGEHLDKAGAYGLQSAGGALVERIDGSPTNVIGLPLVETTHLLRACGIPVGGGV